MADAQQTLEQFKVPEGTRMNSKRLEESLGAVA
jgi:hypothetical protein